MGLFVWLKRMFTLALVLLVGGRVRTPEGIEPVTDFDVNRYLGTWYEIARLDHSFERGSDYHQYSVWYKIEIKFLLLTDCIYAIPSLGRNLILLSMEISHIRSR